MEIVTPDSGVSYMRLWGVPEWSDPGGEYVLWDNACIFCFVPQDGFVDVHMAMDSGRQRDCRKAGAALLKHVGHHRLRAVILIERPWVCNYAARMGFRDKTIQTLTTINGSESSFFIMWREPGEYHGRCD